MSNALTFQPSGTTVVSPYSDALNWELELGFVLRAPLENATPREAEGIGGRPPAFDPERYKQRHAV